MTIQQALLKLSRLDYESFEETLKVISETTAMVLDVERVSIWLYDSEKSALVCQDFFKVSQNLHSRVITLYEHMYPIYFKALMTEQIIAVRDVYTEYKLSEVLEIYIKPSGITSMMDVPIRRHGHRCGVMCCEHTGQMRDWLSEEQDFVISVSNLVSIALEIHERKKSEELLRLREKALEKNLKELEDRVKERKGELEKTNEILKFENQVKNTPLAYIEFDRELKISAWNPAAERFFGYKINEVIGRHGNIVLPSSVKEQTDIRQNLINYTRGMKKTSETITKDGRKIICNWYNTPLIDEKGNFIGLASLIQDITEQKEMEKELKKSKEAAEQANIAKSQFLATMSHEIRTPLNAIIGMTSLLMETPVTEEQKEFIETIRISSDNLLRIISDILDFSKIEAERFELEYQSFNLRTCIEEALNLVFPKNHTEDIEILYIFHNDTPQGIRGDLTKVMQILVNLLSNAVKFTEKGDIILTVSSKHISENNYEILFAVKDSGIGIAQDKVSLLFRPFSQVDNSTKRKYEGTGLGLAISKKLCEMMGGRMWVESEETKGTTFYFTIIAQASYDIPWDFPSGNQQKLSGKKLLIVNKKELTGNLVKSYCNAWGMDVTTVSSVSEALRWIMKENKVDGVIIDIPITDMDNKKIVSEIHEYLSHRKVPLIMFSSMREQFKTISPDSVSYLTKPFKPFELYSTLNKIFTDYTGIKYTYPGESDDRNEDKFIRILLAEDRIINQQVALRLLEHCGYMADIASNGIEVLESLKRQLYDVILMDVQMPEMNGLEATRIIRKDFPEDRQPWIIAMTAGAFTHDRNECFRAGMNDYISKPIKLDKLKESLSKCKRLEIYETCLLPTISDIENKEKKLLFNHKDIFDSQELMKNLDGDEELFQELIDIFLDTIPSEIASLKEALGKKDFVMARRYAHSIKGVSGNIKAKTLSSMALNIEMAAKEADLEKALSLVADIEEEFILFKRLIL